MTTNHRDIYAKPVGDPVEVAVKQYQVMEDAFYNHQTQTRILQTIIDSLSDEEFAEYLKRTQP